MNLIFNKYSKPFKTKGLLNRYRGEILYGLSNYVTPIATTAANIIAVKFISPFEFGVINTVLLLLPYFSFIHLGVFNGLNRNIAFYHGQGDLEKVQRMVNASHSVALINIAVGIVIYFSTLIYFFISDYPVIYFVSSLLLLVNLFFGPLSTHYDTTYRSGQHFKQLGKINILTNIVYLLLSFTPIFLGYFGRVISNSVRVLSNFFFRYLNQPIKAAGKGNTSEALGLMKVGFPLLISGYITSILMVSDRTVIAYFLGPASLGYYSLSILLISTLSVIPTSLNTILYPRASATYGQSKSNVGLRRFYWQSLLINTAVVFPICIVLFFALEPLVNWFIPNYNPGIESAKINLLSCLTLIYQGPSIIMGVVRRNFSIIAVNLVSLGIIWGSSYILSKDNLTLVKVAWLRFIISFIGSASILAYTYYLTTLKEFRA